MTCLNCSKTLDELCDNVRIKICYECEVKIWKNIKKIENIVDCVSENILCKKLKIYLISDRKILKMYLFDCGIGIVEIIKSFSLKEIKEIFNFSDIEMIVVNDLYF